MRRSRESSEKAARGGRGSRGLRRVDELVGPWLLSVLGAVRPSRSLPLQPQRIGLMKTTGIGDVVLLTAIARDVVRSFPDSDVVLIAGPENAALAGVIRGVRVVVVPPTDPRRAATLLRRERFDVLVDFGQWSKLEAVLSRLSGSACTVGFATPGQRRHAAYDIAVPHADDVPEIDNYRRLVAGAGVSSISEPVFETPTTPAGGPPSDEPYVVFHLWPGGFRSELREWPQERWRALVAQVVRDGYRVLLSGAPTDAARTEAFVAGCAEPSGRVTSIAGRYSLPEMVGVLAGASCVVSVNTGVMHLAAAVGTRTIALNGPTSSLRWGPRGPAVVNVDSTLPGCGYLNLGFEYDGRRTDCMDGISVDRVTAVVRQEKNA